MLAKIGKIIGIAVVAGIALLAALWLLLFVSLFYESRTTHWNSTPDENGFSYLYWDGLRKKAAVTDYLYDPASGSVEITIPEADGSYPVEALGGNVGRGGGYPFSISVKGVHVNALVHLSGDSLEWYADGKDTEIIYVDLELQIGPNIRSVFADQCGLYTGSKLYIPRVSISCDADNEKFYSVNGRLYNKDGSLVEGFIYRDKDEIH